MASKFLLISALIIGTSVANPAAKTAFWKGTPLDGMVEEMRSSCDSGSDSIACIKVKVLSFLDTVFKKDNFQLSDDVEVRANGYTNDVTARGENGLLDTVEQYLKSHDVTFKLPVADTKVTVSPRNLNDDELNLKIKLSSGEGRGRKSKLKKIAIPIMVFVLLKAMTLIPLALGILGLKAWNALQLGFFSFIVSVGLAIFQLCKKIAAEHHHPHAHIAAHGPWDTRSFSEDAVPNFDAQNLAYNAYA